MKRSTIMTTRKHTEKNFIRVLYSPYYVYHEGIESVIQRDIQGLIEEHDSDVWTPSDSTIIEVIDGRAYGRTEIYRAIDVEA